MHASKSLSFEKNPAWRGYTCLACDRQYPHRDYPHGCPQCAGEGRPANVFCRYESNDELLSLPYQTTPDLGQGHTPLVAMPGGVSKGRFKLELSNPTGSHKDRMAAFGVAHAKAIGKQGVIAASSGNAGVAIAAYAAACGLACEIAVTPTCHALYREMMQSYGSIVTPCESSLARWEYVEQRVSDPTLLALTNYSVPAIGSPAVSIEGYKAIALELILQCSDQAIARVYVPTARGDLLWGLYLGFSQALAKGKLKTLPKLIAVEPFSRLTLVLQGTDYRASFHGKTLQFSTSGSTVTLQALAAIQRTAGYCIAVSDEHAIQARSTLASQGFYFELCAAAAWQAYALDAQRIAQDSDIKNEEGLSIVIATAHGSRDALSLTHPL